MFDSRMIISRSSAVGDLSVDNMPFVLSGNKASAGALEPTSHQNLLVTHNAASSITGKQRSLIVQSCLTNGGVYTFESITDLDIPCFHKLLFFEGL
jgi:hypothetical protein